MKLPNGEIVVVYNDVSNKGKDYLKNFESVALTDCSSYEEFIEEVLFHVKQLSSEKYNNLTGFVYYNSVTNTRYQVTKTQIEEVL